MRTEPPAPPGPGFRPFTPKLCVCSLPSHTTQTGHRQPVHGLERGRHCEPRSPPARRTRRGAARPERPLFGVNLRKSPRASERVRRPRSPPPPRCGPRSALTSRLRVASPATGSPIPKSGSGPPPLNQQPPWSHKPAGGLGSAPPPVLTPCVSVVGTGETGACEQQPQGRPSEARRATGWGPRGRRRGTLRSDLGGDPGEGV